MPTKNAYTAFFCFMAIAVCIFRKNRTGALRVALVVVFGVLGNRADGFGGAAIACRRGI